MRLNVRSTTPSTLITKAGNTKINQDLETHVDTTLKTKLPVDQTFTAPVMADAPDRPLRVRIDYADLKLNLDSLRLGLKDDTDRPERVPSPFGPAGTGLK